MRAVIIYDPSSSRQPFIPTIATPTSPLILVPPITNYQDYFSHSETNSFRGCYADVLSPCAINPDNARRCHYISQFCVANLRSGSRECSDPVPDMASRGEGEGGLYCAPPLSVKIHPKDGAAVTLR